MIAKWIFISAALLVICAGCTKGCSSESDLHKHTMYMDIPSGPLGADPSYLDPVVSGVELNNPQAAAKSLGKRIWMERNTSGAIQVLNADSTELLELTLDLDKNDGSFSSMRLKLVDPEQMKNSGIPVKDNILNFMTSRGVKLGMTQLQLKKFMGKDQPIAENTTEKKTLVQYRIQGQEQSDYLKRHKASAYFANYVFEDNKLVHIFWGLEFK